MSPSHEMALAPRPRGSTPTMSNRSVMSLGSTAATLMAKSLAVPPGPPGFTNRAPMRSSSLAAGTRAMVSVRVSPSGAE